MAIVPSRRSFVTTLSLAGAVGALRAPVGLAAAGASATTTLRLTRSPSVCLAPRYVAEDLLRAEGFSDIRYVDTASAIESTKAIAAGQADLSLDFVSAFIIGLDWPADHGAGRCDGGHPSGRVQAEKALITETCPVMTAESGEKPFI
jgi:NitT/TauT family transport system substrate-binding protein